MKGLEFHYEALVRSLTYAFCPSVLFPHYLGKHLPVCSDSQAAEVFRLSEKGGGVRPLG